VVKIHSGIVVKGSSVYNI